MGSYQALACVAAYIVLTFLDSFRNKSGKPQPIRTKVGTHPQLKGRQRSQNFWRDQLNGGEMESSNVSTTLESFVSTTVPDDFSATLQWPIYAKFGHETWIGDETQILDRNFWKVSIQRSFALKTPNLEWVKQAPHSEQATGQEMHGREILFTLRCSPRAREFPRSVNFS